MKKSISTGLSPGILKAGQPGQKKTASASTSIRPVFPMQNPRAALRFPAQTSPFGNFGLSTASAAEKSASILEKNSVRSA
jgi:hypothetical protein